MSDLEEIALFLGTTEGFDNPLLARTTVSQLRTKCRALAHFPGAYQLKPEFGPGIRRAVFKRYVILFRETETEIRVERIVHAARDLAAVMGAP